MRTSRHTSQGFLQYTVGQDRAGMPAGTYFHTCTNHGARLHEDGTTTS